MSVLTLAEARTAILRRLDDVNGNRFAKNGSNLGLDDGLRWALTACLEDYVTAGGSAFDVEATVSSVLGVASLASIAPLHIRSVQINDGVTFYRVQPCERADKVTVDLNSRTLSVVSVRDYALSTTAGDPLVGVGAVAAPSWQAFDQWVVAEAALHVGILDNDKRPGLEALAARARASVIDRIDTPRSRPLRHPGQTWPWYRRLGWTWQQSTTALTLITTQDGG